MSYSCRICETTLPEPLLVLEKMPLTDDFILVHSPDRLEYLEDICIFECWGCGLVQNPADFGHKDYYRNYQYTSGHSAFVQSFMRRYAEVVCDEFQRLHQRQPSSVLEIGSGDGEQLRHFKYLSVPKVLGIEPSECLARLASDSGIPTQVDLFGRHSKNKIEQTFDICLSSYTLDHVRNPIEYLQTAHSLLIDGGILAFEVHDLEKIIERTEYCLFEHEHTIYLTPDSAMRLVNSQGFEVLTINPMPENEVRGNSLIIVAIKQSPREVPNALDKPFTSPLLSTLNHRIQTTVAKLDAWIESLPIDASLIGFGAGGRGVMTLAALNHSSRFKALFDSNYVSDVYLAPKTRLPVVGVDKWRDFNKAYCLVFSFGYFDEIKAQLLKNGFNANKILSLAEFFPVNKVD